MTHQYIKHTWFGGGRMTINSHYQLPGSPPPPPPPAPAPAMTVGVNIHQGGGNASANTVWATQLSYRGMRTNRVDVFGGDQTLLRDMVTKIRANSGTVQGVLFPSGYSTYVERSNFSAAYVEGYGNFTNGTHDLVMNLSDIITDWELLNEVQNRPEIAAVLTRNSITGNAALITGLTAPEGLSHYMRGMCDAIRDVASATGRTLRIILGHHSRDYAWIDYLVSKGVSYDVLGFHYYPNAANPSFTADTWYYPTGPAGMLARFNKPVTINEFNADEIYNASYENSAGGALTEQGFSSVAKHIREIRSTSASLTVESVVFYEWIDRVALGIPAPEGVFGLNKDISTPKVALYIATAHGGGTMSENERLELTSRGLMTTTEINSYGGTVVPSAPPPPAPASYAFGTKPGTYATGIRPTYESDTAMTNRLKAMYDTWKLNRIFAHPTIAGGYYSRFNQYPTYACVSEGQGYAMLIVALFGGYDAQAQTVYDGLLKVARTRYAYNRVNSTYGNAGYFLMDWRLQTANVTAGDGYDAPDGDLDIALSLLMAHRQWGSNGTWNYLKEAINTIHAMQKVRYYTDPFGGHLSAVQDQNTTRTSDFMIQHFRDFAQANTTNAAIWGAGGIISNYHRIINYIQLNYAPNTGLQPDFVINSNTATPAPTNGAAGTTDPGSTTGGYYAYNACRNPWRMGTDVYFSNDPNWVGTLTKLVNFFYNRYVNAGGGVAGVMTAIDLTTRLDGVVLTTGDDAPFIAPVMVGAGALGSTRPFQQFLNDIWAWNATHNNASVYYGGDIQILSMAVVAGHWWRPNISMGANLTITGGWTGSGSGPWTKGVGWLSLGYVGGAGAVGKKYEIEFTVTAITGTAVLYVFRRNAANTADEVMDTHNVVVNGTYRSHVTVVTNNGANASVWIDNTAFTGTITGVYVREVLS